MKVKRYKRAKRLISIYRYNFGLEPPYRVLVDGTFAMAALQDKINLREQLPKYLNAEVEICVTRCVLEELEKLGSMLYGALHICRQFDVEPCPHYPVRTAAECIKHMARRMKRKTIYFIATQDDAVTEAVKQIPGVPVLFIKYNGILIDKPSQATIEEIGKPKDELSEVKKLKKAAFGEKTEKPRRKRKGPKGPNPLSVKKKKKKQIGILRKSDPNNEAITGNRRRNRKKKVRIHSDIPDSSKGIV